ncbi:hypothetical protein Stsp02_51530 [Streptomyces sp. NBRC 14336]|nr:hypothetical protein Stsp02_51530 [Streptomyces sp. NBRC 14336]
MLRPAVAASPGHLDELGGQVASAARGLRTPLRLHARPQADVQGIVVALGAGLGDHCRRHATGQVGLGELEFGAVTVAGATPSPGRRTRFGFRCRRGRGRAGSGELRVRPAQGTLPQPGRVAAAVGAVEGECGASHQQRPGQAPCQCGGALEHPPGALLFTGHLECEPEIKADQHASGGVRSGKAVQSTPVMAHRLLVRQPVLRVPRRRQHQLHRLVPVQFLEGEVGMAGQLHGEYHVRQGPGRLAQCVHRGGVEAADPLCVQVPVERLAHQIVLEDHHPRALLLDQLSIGRLGQPAAYLRRRAIQHPGQDVGAEPTPQHRRRAQAVRHRILQQAQTLLERGAQAG